MTSIVIVVVLWLNGAEVRHEVPYAGNLVSCRLGSTLVRAMDEAQVSTGGAPLRAYCLRKDTI